MSGPLSVPFAALALLVSSRSQKILFGCLAAVCAIFASYRVWRKERLSNANTVGKQHQRIEELEAQIVRLQVRPYDAARREAAQQILHNLTSQERDLLRFLLNRGRTTAFIINGSTQLDPAESRRMLARLVNQDLIGRDEDHNLGVTSYWVLQNWSVLFQDLSFPRDEQVQPECFRVQ
jgi:hypothetical protein